MFGFQLVLEPRASTSPENPFFRRPVVKVWEPVLPASTLEGFDVTGGLLIQRNFIGVGIGIEGLSRDREMLTALQHERVCDAPEEGAPTARLRRSIWICSPRSAA